MTLALLLTAVTGAWADEVLLTTINASSGFTNGTQTFDNIVTVTLDDVFYAANKGWYCPGSPHSVEVAPVNGVTVTGYVLYFSATDPIEYEGSSFTVALEGNRVSADDISTQLGSVGITKIEVYGTAAPSGPEVTLNADKDEATMEMPASDVTVTYELVRDLAVQTQFVGVPTEPVAVKKDGDKFVFASGTAPAVALIDLLADNAPILDGATYYFEKQNAETGDFEASTVNLLADAQPGTWRIVTTATADGPYDGTVRSDAFTLVEQYDLTVKPANDFSKGKIDAVTVGGETVTPDATTGKATKTGIAPGTEVKLKAKRGYVIEKVEAKKHATK